MQILKEEINNIGDQLLSLGKWKIGIVAAAVASGLGWGDLASNADTGILIIASVGFLCVYIDVLVYRRYERLHILARFIRDTKLNKEADNVYTRYEQHIAELRTKDVNGRKVRNRLLSERWIMVTSSSVFCIGSAVLGYFRYECEKPYSLVILPFIAIVAIWILFIYYDNERDVFLDLDDTNYSETKVFLRLVNCLKICMKKYLD